jgi:hypothetical protein
MITPTIHEKAEWARLAQAAYEQGYNRIGHRYSAAASMPEGMRIQAWRFNDLQSDYADWLVFGEWPR